MGKEQEESKEKIDDFAVILSKFASNTTAHGFSQIIINTHILSKLLWVACIIGCQVMLYVTIKPLATQFTLKPIRTRIVLEDEKSQVFPVITICNTNNIMKSQLDRLKSKAEFEDDEYWESDDELKESDTSKRQKRNAKTPRPRDGTHKTTAKTTDKSKSSKKHSRWKPAEKDSEFKTKEEVVEHYARRNDILQRITRLAEENGPEVFQYGHQFEDMVIQCKWKDYYDCSWGDWWKKIWHWRYGNCYSFNAGDNASKVHTITGTGPYDGISLTLALNQTEYIDNFMTETAGIILHVGEQGARIEPYLNGYSLAPNFAYYIRLKKKKVLRVDPFKNQSCRNHHKADLGKRSFSQRETTKYSLNACKEICEASTQIKECGCSSYWLPSLNANRTCDVEDAECTEQISDYRINENLTCLKQCNLPCNEVKYEFDISSSDFPTAKERFGQSYQKYDRDNILKVTISFQTLETEVWINEEYYFLVNLLSDIGGQLGLWSGISALTVIELCFFLGNTVYFFMRYCGYRAAGAGKKAIETPIEFLNGSRVEPNSKQL